MGKTAFWQAIQVSLSELCRGLSQRYDIERVCRELGRPFTFLEYWRKENTKVEILPDKLKRQGGKE